MEAKNRAEEITPDRLMRILNGEEEWFLLDVRNDIEFEQWKIEGKKTPLTMNIPYFDFFDDDDELIKKIPSDRPTLVVCSRGDSSAFVADILRNKGRKALNLKGGVIAWGNYYTAQQFPATGKEKKLFQINRVAKGCLSYLFLSEGEALVIDPGRHIDVYTDLAGKENTEIIHVMDTHLHADHISGGAALAKAVGAEYHIQKADVGSSPLSYQELRDGESFRVGESSVQVIAHFHPGHTPGSTSFLLDKKFLMTGDTLFVNGVGRPDLGGKVDEWARMLYNSLFQKLSRLSGDLVILPSHHSDPYEINENGLVMGSLSELREKNPALKIDNEEDFVRYMLTQISPQPDIYQNIRLVNLEEKFIDEETASEMELGKNECAAKQHA